MILTKQQATEQLDLEQALERLPVLDAHVDKLLARLRRVCPMPPGARILDIGAAQGLFLIACARRGLDAEGVEPWEPARRVAHELASREGLDITVRPGVAESLPQPDESLDIVHANAVFEHVSDPQVMLNEVYRVLKPGGVFWFSGASSMCPRQAEISRFPLFGWYPDRLKRRIMAWAKVNKPHLIGHTDRPAVNWLTPRKANRLLRRAGFTRVYGRWDLRLPSEGGRMHALVLRAIRSSRLVELLADVLVSACSYAAIKGSADQSVRQPRRRLAACG